MKHLVMIIEDEEALALMLKYNLEKEGYDRFVSIEMGRINDIGILEAIMAYVRRTFE